MFDNHLDSYTQSLLDRVVSLTKEIDNLHAAYLIVNNRLNHLASLTEQSSKELIEEAVKVEDFARLAVEATKLTEKSALITNNEDLIRAAKKSSLAASNVHRLAVELRTVKLAKLKADY
ncbi:hypothetical protein [Polynucleobacter sp. MG-27-Goln-C1]|uniref:hypothetical protein n=1 Tax=Polynucleobacter sp. MG-27-Goln-C1 TaxID=1819726 RepID=UPI001C0BE10D|nr:hypothetical protein [Polynucleobacter sp. MG-27-Goln-C1]MBU3613238.1 hypothetical protein [Polynucleobacter sp. MG-27-Goln-C1]